MASKFFFVLEKGLEGVERCTVHKESMLSVTKERFSLSKMQISFEEFRQALFDIAKIARDRLFLEQNLHLEVEAFGFCKYCGAFFARCKNNVLPEAYWEETSHHNLDPDEYFVFIDPNQLGCKVFVNI